MENDEDMSFVSPQRSVIQHSILIFNEIIIRMSNILLADENAKSDIVLIPLFMEAGRTMKMAGTPVSAKHVAY